MRRVFVVVVACALGCSSGGDDASREGEACSRGKTTAACDTCAQQQCKTLYEGAFRTDAPAGACADEARCISRCPCGDTACYDYCPPSIDCSAALFALRNCEFVRCRGECSAALEGVGGACIDLARCCDSPGMPDSRRNDCRNTAAEGIVFDSARPTRYCEPVLESFRLAGWCD